MVLNVNVLLFLFIPHSGLCGTKLGYETDVH